MLLRLIIKQKEKSSHWYFKKKKKKNLPMITSAKPEKNPFCLK